MKKLLLIPALLSATMASAQTAKPTTTTNAQTTKQTTLDLFTSLASPIYRPAEGKSVLMLEQEDKMNVNYRYGVTKYLSIDVSNGLDRLGLNARLLDRKDFKGDIKGAYKGTGDDANRMKNIGGILGWAYDDYILALTLDYKIESLGVLENNAKALGLEVVGYFETGAVLTLGLNFAMENNEFNETGILAEKDKDNVLKLKMGFDFAIGMDKLLGMFVGTNLSGGSEESSVGVRFGVQF